MKRLVENLVIIILFVIACTFFVLACDDNEETNPPDASVVDMISDSNIDVEVIEDTEPEGKDLEETD